MNRFTALIFLGALLLTGCTPPRFLSDPLIPAALKVDAQPKAEVYLDDKLIGSTPLNKRDLKAGAYKVSLVSPQGSWTGPVQLHGSTVTIVNRILGSASAGETITLEAGKGITVIGTPQDAQVTVNNKAEGKLPLVLNDLPSGMQNLIIAADGFEQRTLSLKTTDGYKLIVNVDLAQKGSANQHVAQQSPTPQTANKPVVVTPSPAASQPTQQATKRVQVGQTPTGWLRLRAQPSTSSQEIAKVNTGESFDVLEEAAGWYKVKLVSGQEGWISGQFAVAQ